jgi:hypothetical protein
VVVGASSAALASRAVDRGPRRSTPPPRAATARDGLPPAWTSVLALTRVPGLSAAPVRPAPAAAAPPFRAAPLAAPPFRVLAVLAALAALVWLRWAWACRARACRARLDFDAVIRASPPVSARCSRDFIVRVLSQA